MVSQLALREEIFIDKGDDWWCNVLSTDRHSDISWPARRPHRSLVPPGSRLSPVSLQTRQSRQTRPASLPRYSWRPRVALSSLLSRQTSGALHPHNARDTERAREALYPLGARRTSLPSGAPRPRLPDRSWNSRVSLSSGVAWGSDGTSNALLSSLSLFANPALSSHQSWLASPPFVSWRPPNPRLARTACQPHGPFPPVFSLHPRGSRRPVLPRSPRDSPQPRRPRLAQSSPRAGEASVSSLALDPSETEYSLYPVLAVSPRSSVLARSSPHSLESSGPGTASVSSLPARSWRPWPAEISNPANPAWVSPGSGLALVTNISLRAHQTHLPGISDPALSPHQP